MVDDLAWLGIRFASPPRRQSERGADHAGALARLEALGLVYPCFCSRAEAARTSAAPDPDGAALYAGICRGLARDESAARIARGEKAARRLDMAGALSSVGSPIVWLEFGEGSEPAERIAEPAAWGDVVLVGRDGAASYHLAVTVDDAGQGITDAVRGRDLLPATSVHRLLQELLGLHAPRYRHHRLVLDADGRKLSKSRGSEALSALRERGVSAADVRAGLGFVAGGAGPLSVRLS
jgi:glutamyl-Q tRNA(Asp) synthetase